MSLPWPDWTTAEWTAKLAVVAEPRALYREDQLRAPKGVPEGGQFAEEGKGGGAAGGTAAVDAPILAGVDSRANAEREVAKHRERLRSILGTEPTPEQVAAAEAELRALPLVHGTTVAGALGASADGLLSYRDMQARKEEFLDAAEDLRTEIQDTWGWPGEGDDMMDYSAEDLQQYMDLSRSDAEEMAGKIAELRGIERVLKGTTGRADVAVGLDRFVFMTHGTKHQDYGNVAVVIDNEVLEQPGSFATEKDIVVTEGTLGPSDYGSGIDEVYAEGGIRNYQRTIVQGDDYYRVAAAAAGTPEAIAYRSREQLFEIKAPRVPASAVKGFVVEGEYEVAKHLAEELASRGERHKVLYIDENYGPEKRAFMQAQLKAIQSSGMWDEDALEEFRKNHEGVYIL